MQTFKNIINETKQTEWPNLNTTTRYTILVIGALIVFGVLIAISDLLLFQLRNFVINR